MAEPKYFTRKELPSLIREKCGAVMSLSTIERDAWLGRGPEPTAECGNRLLYTEEAAVKYGLSKIRKLTPETEAAA